MKRLELECVYELQFLLRSQPTAVLNRQSKTGSTLGRCYSLEKKERSYRNLERSDNACCNKKTMQENHRSPE